ncbi:L,D-transpeptidase [Mesorhizobium shangrilense]|uniref:L,D-transpeptidase n=1 Tax=Mesorhizobium shangrilense TaxID=460060 RepID=A0ABV2DMS5_9HYPH
MIGASAFALAGCVSTPPTATSVAVAIDRVRKPEPPLMYAAMPDELFPVPAVDISKVDPRWWRAEVDYDTAEKPGTVIVDTPARYLYHVNPGGRATRYGIGVGRDGFSWSGRAIVAYKRKWPRWTPPDEMVARQPKLKPYSIANGGMGPGLNNPLGSRALYIHQGGRDTIYRIHGSPEANSIGKAVSSGCIRLLNQDVIHLYDQVRDGSPIVVIPDPAMGHLMVG